MAGEDTEERGTGRLGPATAVPGAIVPEPALAPILGVLGPLVVTLALILPPSTGCAPSLEPLDITPDADPVADPDPDAISTAEVEVEPPTPRADASPALLGVNRARAAPANTGEGDTAPVPLPLPSLAYPRAEAARIGLRGRP